MVSLNFNAFNVGFTILLIIFNSNFWFIIGAGEYAPIPQYLDQYHFHQLVYGLAQIQKT